MCRLLLLLLVWTSSACAYRNVALRGKATQSSRRRDDFSNANNAIDGNTASNYNTGSCTQTDEQTDPWWRVDLLDSYIITSITVYNRGDCCSERLDGAQIHVGNSLVNEGKSNPLVAQILTPAGLSQTFNFDDKFVVGRYVSVMLSGAKRILTLCEVEVRGLHELNGENLAIRGKASQSSVYNNELAYYAIDGNRQTAGGDHVCSYTNQDFPAWWRLDLGKRHRIFSVIVVNREVNGRGLNGAEIRIGDSLANNGNDNPRCAVITNPRRGTNQGFVCNGMNGQYVNIVIPGQPDILNLCEVEVYGSVLD